MANTQNEVVYYAEKRMQKIFKIFIYIYIYIYTQKKKKKVAEEDEKNI